MLFHYGRYNIKLKMDVSVCVCVCGCLFIFMCQTVKPLPNMGQHMRTWHRRMSCLRGARWMASIFVTFREDVRCRGAGRCRHVQCRGPRVSEGPGCKRGGSIGYGHPPCKRSTAHVSQSLFANSSWHCEKLEVTRDNTQLGEILFLTA